MTENRTAPLMYEDSDGDDEGLNKEVAEKHMALIVDREGLEVLDQDWLTDETRANYEDDQAFFENTNFGEQVLLVVALSESDDSTGLKLTDVVRTDEETIRSYTYVTDPSMHDDGHAETVIARVDLEGGPVPERAKHTHLGRDEYTLSTSAGADLSESPERRTVSIADTGSVPSDADLSITASLPRKQITSEAPARLTVKVTNTGSHRATDLTDRGYCHLFNRGRGGSDPAGLWLYREQDRPDDRAGDRWTQNRNATDTRAFVMVDCPRETFAKGESITTTYEVWDDYVADGYFSPGTYRFDANIGLRDSVDDDSDPRIIDWWLELEVTTPHHNDYASTFPTIGPFT
jgi:hypothetical protein